jgi:N-acetylglucosaminyldiphosphoundecaprenol N-acetyl-beta-D-mannosaminyltransferase
MQGAVARIESWIRSGAVGRYVCITGVHGVMEGLRDKSIRTIHNRADAVMPDGMPLTWLGWSRGQRAMDRVYGPALMLSLLEQSAAKGYTNYFYGGKPGVVETLESRMTQRFPGLKVVGRYSPPFRPLTAGEETSVVEDINRRKPDLLWIGLSTPKQEIRMASFQGRVSAGVMLGVGAAFDFHAGLVRQAPYWIQRSGCEWLFRLCMEPRRLAGRYLRNNPLFLFHLLLQTAGLRDYPLETVDE